ncbi:plasmid mobilization relaxosome protein MobC [Bacteroides caecimuris]|jgi:UDP-N-acetylglucosamine enolpyruvyl transferase|uniref:plasmid mobilization relaxosome protein MobC n=1 Tax=Bacteroides caecimuris TaxID=1796613 RepID=UPI0026480B38|nr:plasmid mobilization relaxosome protein MobC [Bacteroides caecimuris]
MSSNNKNIIIRLRVDEVTAKAIRAKADSHFNGNISACIRCATLLYNGEVTLSPANSEITALLSAILRQLKKIGTNVNQTARQINERMKVSPYGLSASDIQPFVFFRNDLSAIWVHLKQIKIKERL